MDSLTIDRFSLKGFQNHLGSYDSIIDAKMSALDPIRYQTIPEVVARRKQQDDAFLEKTEISELMEWKLKHGTFRPKLAQLVKENSDDICQTLTREAFKLYEEGKAVDGYKKAMNKLKPLKGIGPATASLLLSVYDPDNVPFFSDELFRWAHWEASGAKGWERKISYTAKEYYSLWDKVQGLRERLGKDVKAVDCEKVAYVLPRAALQVQSDAAEGEDEREEKEVSPASKKRKADKPKAEPKTKKRQKK